jgi:exosortase K
MQSLAPSIVDPNKTHTSSIPRSVVIAQVMSRIPGAALTFLIMFLLKRHYSLASADQLDWMLSPTAKLIGWFTWADPMWESGVGYVDFSKGMIIAPACAGINFMIICFGLAALYGLIHIRRTAAQAAWLVLALGGAYGLALLVNTMRIGVSMVLYQTDMYGHWLTLERVHRITGVGIYVSVLWLYFLCLRSIIPSYCKCFDHYYNHSGIHPPVWLTVAWYVLGTVGVPLINQAWKQDMAGFSEHCITVGLVALVFGTAFVAMGRLFHSPFQRASYLLADWCGKGFRRICR